MKTKRIVITGGPGSGKTTLIRSLEQKGYDVMHEISRQITLEAQQNGTEQLFLEDPLLFSEKLLEGRMKQFEDAKNCDAPVLFYDRGLGDVTAYLDYAGVDYPSEFKTICDAHLYDRVFVLPPWKDIYHSDNERYENFDQANEIFQYLKKAYKAYGYFAYQVPIGTIEERVAFILESTKDLH